MTILKRAVFLALVRFDIRFNLSRFDNWAIFLDYANEYLWPEYDGEGTGGESFVGALLK